MVLKGTTLVLNCLLIASDSGKTIVILNYYSMRYFRSLFLGLFKFNLHSVPMRVYSQTQCHFLLLFTTYKYLCVNHDEDVRRHKEGLSITPINNLKNEPLYNNRLCIFRSEHCSEVPPGETFYLCSDATASSRSMHIQVGGLVKHFLPAEENLPVKVCLFCLDRDFLPGGRRDYMVQIQLRWDSSVTSEEIYFESLSLRLRT